MCVPLKVDARRIDFDLFAAIRLSSDAFRRVQHEIEAPAKDANIIPSRVYFQGHLLSRPYRLECVLRRLHAAVLFLVSLRVVLSSSHVVVAAARCVVVVRIFIVLPEVEVIWSCRIAWVFCVGPLRSESTKRQMALVVVVGKSQIDAKVTTITW